ncbi:MAG: hypothetical protein AAF367_08835 [Pseudomonadota bacterium]
MGLSPSELSERVFGGAAQEKRILDIENGLTERPHSRTMSALSNALWITPEQIEECNVAMSKRGDLPPQIEAHIKECFEAAQPAATSSEFEYLLRGKRADYLAVRKGIATAIDAAENGVNFANRLNQLLEKAAFDSCDQQIERRQRERSSIASKVALIRLRGDIMMIACEAQRAAQRFMEAADLLNPIVPDGAADLRNAAANRLYRHAHKMNRDHDLPAALLRLNLTYWRRKTYPEKWAMTQVNLANALYLHAASIDERDAEPLLQEAIAGYRQGLEIYSETEHRQEWILAQSNFAAALSAYARSRKGKEKVELLQEAATAFRVSLDATNKRTKPGTWAGYNNRLSNVLGQQATTQPPPVGTALFDQARDAGTAALSVYSPDKTPLHWVATQNSLANALRAQAAQSTKSDAVGLLSDAISNYRTAINACDRTQRGAQWSALHNNLALALIDQAKLGNRLSSTALLTEAIKACQTALTERSQTQNVTDWAMSQMLLGEAYLARASCSRGDGPLNDTKEAITALEAVRANQDSNSSPARLIANAKRVADAHEMRADLMAAEGIADYDAAQDILVEATTIAEQARMAAMVNRLKQQRARISEKVRRSRTKSTTETALNQ